MNENATTTLVKLLRELNLTDLNAVRDEAERELDAVRSDAEKELADLLHELSLNELKAVRNKAITLLQEQQQAGAGQLGTTQKEAGNA